MLKAGSLLLPIIKSYIHHETQEFIQNGLRELIYHAAKKKKLGLRFVGIHSRLPKIIHRVHRLELSSWQ